MRTLRGERGIPIPVREVRTLQSAPDITGGCLSEREETNGVDGLTAERLQRLYKGKIAQEIVNGKTNLAGELLTLQKAENMAKRPLPRSLDKLRPKRRYNLSDEALEARRANARKSTGPLTAEGQKASRRNACKHRNYASTLLMQLRKPCLSTCKKFDSCEVVGSGNTRPGLDCLDKAHFLEAMELIADALEGDHDGLKDLMVVELAGALDVIRMMREDISQYGTLIREEELDDHGHVVRTVLKPNPLLTSFPRLMADFGITLGAWNLTPAQISKVKTDEKTAETAADLMSALAGRAREAKQ